MHELLSERDADSVTGGDGVADGIWDIVAEALPELDGVSDKEAETEKEIELEGVWETEIEAVPEEVSVFVFDGVGDGVMDWVAE